MARLKDFNYKDFLLRYGEYVGFGAVAALIVLLLVLYLFLPGKGFLSGSPTANAKELSDLSKGLDSKIKNAVGPKYEPLSNSSAIKQIPPIIDPNDERFVASIFEYKLPNASKRSQPRILRPDEEWLAKVELTQPLFYRFDADHTRIWMLVPVAPKKEDKKPGGQFPGLGGLAGGRGGMPPGAGMPGMGGRGGMPGGAPGMGGMGAGMGMGRGGLGGMSGSPMTSTSGDKKEEAFKFEDLAKVTNGTPEDEMAPIPMAIFVGSIPYKDFLEEYQRALHVSDPMQLLSGGDNAEFRVAEMVVERCSVLPNGKPETDKAGNPLWTPVDRKGQFAWLQTHNGGRFEPIDPKLQPLLVKGFVARLPKQFEGKSYSIDEMKLPRIASTVEALSKVDDAKVLTQLGSVLTQSDKDKLDPDNPFGGGDQPAAFGSKDMTKGGSDAPTGLGGGTKPLGPPTTGVKDPLKGTTAQKTTGQVIADRALVRFIDLSVEAGQSYQYRIKLKMHNPNYDRTDDVTIPEIAKSKFLESDWRVIPNIVTVPSVVSYYAVDMKLLGDDKHKMDLIPDRNQIAVQIHRWLEKLNLAASSKSHNDVMVGDWAIAERMLVYKGEYLGQPGKVHRLKVPYWSPADEAFVLAKDPTLPREKTIDVSFTADGKEDAILVDYEGGDMVYKRVIPPDTEDGQPRVVEIKDKAPRELLILETDGQLVVRNSAKDDTDPERKERVEKWRKRIKEIEEKKDPTKPGGDKSPFGQGAPPGPGGM
jgi:hypothetical protein